MRYLVKAKVKKGQEEALLTSIADGSLGRGSIAGDEYIHDMQQARAGQDGIAHWVETCFCATPLEEERPYWEKYFELRRASLKIPRESCFWGKGWMARRDEGGYSQLSPIEEQRSQPALSTKTRRAACLLPVAGVGPTVPARCGDAPVSPPWPRPKSLAAGPLAIFRQALRVKDAHNRRYCRHENGTEPWACTDCDCTQKLEARMQQQGASFLKTLREAKPSQ